MADIAQFSPRTGRLIKESGIVVNEADYFIDGGLLSIPYQCAIARGLITGAQSFSGFGERVTTGAVTNGLIWPDGTLYIPAAAGVQLSVVSTSANDAAAGTGIRTMMFHYLDANLAPQTEVVTLNGLTPVLTVATNIRFVQDAHAVTVGSLGGSGGTITASYSANTVSQLKIGDTRARSSARMVPAGKKAFISAMVGGAVSGTAAANGHIDVIATQIYDNQYTSSGIFFSHGEVALQDGSATLALPIPGGPFLAGTIIGMSFTMDKAVTVTGTWYGWTENA